MSDDGPEVWRTVDREHPLLEGRTGRGVRIAVIDSGVAAGHPHVGEVAGGLTIAENLETSPDFSDGIGHGTAVAAVLREKAPDAELLAIRIFQRRLTTTALVLERAIEIALERGAHLVNLSLGTENVEHEARLQQAVDRARRHGAVVVSPRCHRGRSWLPGSLRGVVAVELDGTLDRGSIRVRRGSNPPDPSLLTCRASGFPRPVPGVPPERNLRGISFAAANVSGILARARETGPLDALIGGLWGSR